MPFAPDALKGSRVLIAECEPFLADYICAAVASAGGEVLGPLRSVADVRTAVEAVETRPHAAAINIELVDGDTFALADELDGLDVPVLLVSTVHAVTLPSHAAHRRMLAKPFASHQVVHALADVLGSPPVRVRPSD